MALTPEQQSLVSGNLGIAYAVLQRLNIHGTGFSEAKSEAMLALCEAALSYDASKCQFSTWAWTKVRWRLQTWMKRTNAAPRVTLGEAFEVVDEGQGPEAALGAQEAAAAVLRLVHDRRFSACAVAEYLGVSDRAIRAARAEPGELGSFFCKER